MLVCDASRCLLSASELPTFVSDSTLELPAAVSARVSSSIQGQANEGWGDSVWWRAKSLGIASCERRLEPCMGALCCVRQLHSREGEPSASPGCQAPTPCWPEEHSGFGWYLSPEHHKAPCQSWVAGAVLGKYCPTVPASQPSGCARGGKTSHPHCSLGQLIAGGFILPPYPPNKELFLVCFSIAMEQGWSCLTSGQGPLSLPAAGRDNFLSPLRALLGHFHLVSHQTLCLVCGDPQPKQIRSSWSFFSGPPSPQILRSWLPVSWVCCRPKKKGRYNFLNLLFPGSVHAFHLPSGMFSGFVWVFILWLTWQGSLPLSFLCGAPVWSDSL